MRIGLIASMKKGLEQFIYREACGLENEGASISVFPTKQGPGLYSPRVGWNVHRWRTWQVLLAQPWRFLTMPIRYLTVLIEAMRFGAVADFMLAAYFSPEFRNVDVLYASFGDRKLFVGYFGKRLVGVPLAVEIHAHEMYISPNERLFRAALAACDRVIAATWYNRDLLCRRFGVLPERVDVVYYSLNLDDYRPSEKFVILIVGFFSERKGHEVLFRAVKELGLDDIEIWVVGGAGAENQYVDVPDLAKQLGLESQVCFFGKLSGAALRAVYLACDVFCLPCRHEANGNAEGFPNVIIEAMACAKPVVTTRHVEIPRVIEQLLVDENDVDGLAEALFRVYSSASLRERLGARNRELAEEHFSTRNVEKTMQLLRAAANLPAPKNAANTPDGENDSASASFPPPSLTSTAHQPAGVST